MMSLIMKYFVLKPKAKAHKDVYARASQEAMMCYAKIIQSTNDQLACDLRKWARTEMIEQTGMVEAPK